MILVTGAAGYIGGHLINNLLKDEKFCDYGIRGIDNFLVGKKENFDLIIKNKNVNLLKMDITNLRDVKKMLKDVEIVYHLAAISGVQACNNHPYLALRVNVEGTIKLLEEARKKDVKHFIFPSSVAVYSKTKKKIITEDIPTSPSNFYGALKVTVEALCQAYYNSYGLGTTILRFTNIYGKGTYIKWRTVIPLFIRNILENRPITIQGSGQQKRDFIHIDDVVELYKVIVLKKAVGEIFNVGSGESITIKELAHLIKDIYMEKYKREVEIVHISERKNTKEQIFDFSIEKLKKNLSWKPKISIKEGLEIMLEDIIYELKRGIMERQNIL